MFRLSSVLRVLGVLVLVTGLLGCIGAAGLYWYLAPKLPPIESLKDVQLQEPLRVYSRDGRLIAEFGEQRRTPLEFEQVPPLMVKAVLAAEDERFYQHPGVDWQGLTRAVLHLVRTGEKGPGGSTITMQVARNFFLGREKTYVRKINEILLSLKIEKELGKDDILELYLNKIFLGHRAYGVEAAAQVYYGARLEELSIAQVAMIAGLPKAPSRFNPIVNPDRARARRDYVLGRMRELEAISEEEYLLALATPVTARLHGLSVEVEAPYVAEMVRVFVEDRLGDDAYTAGYRVITTIDSRLQEAANQALRKNLLAYDQRHGFRGAELRVDLDATDVSLESVLADIPATAGLLPAVVVEVGEKTVTAYAKIFGEIQIPWNGLEWARAYIDENTLGPELESAGDLLERGDVVRVQLEENGWRLVQVPAVEGALVALSPENGALLALTGGFDFYRSKFNRAVQAERQPGSSFKPFIYSAALDSGFTPASVINDAPVVFDDPGLEAVWRPENYSGKFFGPTRLRVALFKSRNLVSIRLLRAIGINYAVEYLKRFGLDVSRVPHDLSLALGSGSVTPLEMASGYAVLANGGFRVTPFFVDRIEAADGSLWHAADPLQVCRDCDEGKDTALDGVVDSDLDEVVLAEDGLDEEPYAPRALSAQNAWLMNSMMRDVIKRGTGRRALRLKRADLAGKTGTTNDQQDAWFSGFNQKLVTTTWVGFDQLGPLGRRETGAGAALPMWIDFMRVALDGVPEETLAQPDGLVTVRIDPESGLRAGASQPGAVFETFRADNVPREALVETATSPGTRVTTTPESGVTEQLF
ncbi:MAG: PBP1A family penicillin-binding protein [Gammaproteobacteria bacterium]|nr:PBP1A family penicillin-binding protein [Gammaproteobacteria bacterium]NIM74153.1 PBP1A family penicillin-binding protein [Gammaproteobacteria bacterium]NIN39036.1 PBP1A family penicillin-binding protein [Gammaproteobacteria bacterium]NIO25929.1 PBP1A family penicillin-binding protein [Gammaproteobacteria bacterium]NIO66560.1 PBP1A family penicillin-binding protein [Gammaproteobacteria bacterium]